jgi:hypothetical protein
MLFEWVTWLTLETAEEALAWAEKYNPSLFHAPEATVSKWEYELERQLHRRVITSRYKWESKKKQAEDWSEKLQARRDVGSLPERVARGMRGREDESFWSVESLDDCLAAHGVMRRFELQGKLAQVLAKDREVVEYLKSVQRELKVGTSLVCLEAERGLPVLVRSQESLHEVLPLAGRFLERVAKEMKCLRPAREDEEMSLESLLDTSSSVRRLSIWQAPEEIMKGPARAQHDAGQEKEGQGRAWLTSFLEGAQERLQLSQVAEGVLGRVPGEDAVLLEPSVPESGGSHLEIVGDARLRVPEALQPGLVLGEVS